MAGSSVTPTGPSDDFLIRELENIKRTMQQIQSSVPRSVYDIATQITAGLPIASVIPYAGAAAPTGWLMADGTAVSRETYADLFEVIGTDYGAGDGSTTFNLPNLKGRVPVGQDSSQSEFNTLGKTGGTKTHTLTVDQMPSHAHSTPSHSHSFSGSDSHSHSMTFRSPGGVGGVGPLEGGGGGVYNHSTNSTTVSISGTTGGAAPTTNPAGGGTPHNNLQPYIALPYIIKFNKF